MTEPQLRIIHLEDNKNDAEIVASTLTSGGINSAVVLVKNRTDFLAAIETGAMDLIISDYNISPFDGLSALAMARERCPQIPFIFVSGAIGEETAIETMKLGATDYVLKDRLLRLVPAVQRALREVRAAALMKEKNLKIEEQRADLLHVTRVGKLAEFVSSLAHEISQPLTAILSYAQAAERMLKDREPQVREIQRFIIEDDQRAAEVIRRLRALLKKDKPVFESIDINALIKETVLLITTDVTVRNKVINTQLAKDLPQIHGDRIQLQQVLLNLISNSLEAMEGTKNARELLISTLLQDSNMLLVEVKDSGCGILKKNLNKLFTHFFTTKPDGLGMGLSISRSIVEVHGGRLDAKNNPDRGANFYFTLPLISVDKINIRV